MGSRGRGRKDEEPKVEPSSFHAPFRDLAKQVRARARSVPPPRAPVPPPAVAKQPARPGPATRPVPPVDGGVQECAAPPSNDVDFRAGVAPLAPSSGRVVPRPRVDLSRIAAARREDVDAMARAEGFDVSFEDLYVRGRAAGVSRETLARLEKGAFRICAHLDLHGMPLDDARRAVDAFLAEQQKKGRRCVLLVTGKGKNSPRGHGVLREHVPEWLARGPSSRRVLAFASARACDGGVGALVVLMRGDSSSKNRIDVEHGGAGPVEA